MLRAAAPEALAGASAARTKNQSDRLAQLAGDGKFRALRRAQDRLRARLSTLVHQHPELTSEHARRRAAALVELLERAEESAPR